MILIKYQKKKEFQKKNPNHNTTVMTLVLQLELPQKIPFSLGNNSENLCEFLKSIFCKMQFVKKNFKI